MGMDAEDKQVDNDGGTPRTTEGPLYVAGTEVRDHTSKIDVDEGVTVLRDDFGTDCGNRVLAQMLG